MNFLFPYMARWKAVNWTRYHQIFTHLAKLGHNVYVLQPPSSNMKETNFQEIEVDTPQNLRLIDVKLNPVIWNSKLPFNKLFKKGYYAVASSKKVKELITKYQIEVLFLYNIPQFPLMNGNNCIKIFDFADDYIAMLEHELGPLSNKYILKVAKTILNKMIGRADLTLAVSNVLARTINNDERTKIKVLPNGASLEKEVENTIPIKSEYKKPIIGFVGAFEYFIDFDLILGIAEKLPQMTFLLVGGGRDLETVKHKANLKGLKNVILTGPVPHNAVASYIKEMDICLNIFKDMPVSHAACPIKLFEYLLMKKPVISNSLQEVKLIDRNFIFYADTVDEFISKIQLIIENKDLASEYAARGFEITKNEYSWENIVGHFLELIEKIKHKKCL